MTLQRKRLAPVELAWLHKTISSDSLAAIVLHHMEQCKSMSVVRFSDGERGVLQHAETKQANHVTGDAGWITRYGMSGASIQDIAVDLLRAAREATYVSPTISGLYIPSFNLYPYMQDRPYFIDAFYTYVWKANGRVETILRQAKSVHLINRNWQTLAPALEAKYKLPYKITGFALNDWRDRRAAIDSALRSRAELVLISGGPPGKILPVDIAHAMQCVALDVGCGVDTWT